MSTGTTSSVGVSEAGSRTRRRALHGLMVGAALIVASCGGSTSDSGVSSSAPAPADDTPTTTTNAAGANVAAVRAALLESGDPEWAEILGDEALNCIAEAVAADPDLTAQVLADDFDDEAGWAITSITTTCAPEQLASVYVDEFEGLTDDEALCLVEALADSPEILVAPDQSAAAFVEAVFGCAPSVMAAQFAAETGLGQGDAECILGTLVDTGGLAAYGEAMDAGIDENVPLEFLDALARCDISLETLVELGRAAGSSDDQAAVDEIVDAYRSDCADGDMNACSELYSRSPIESDDERFALDGLRAGCAEGEMVGCDLLYSYSPFGSDDEEFGATCGGRTDGSSANSCEQLADPEDLTDDQPTLEEIDDAYREDCADGDMNACSELYSRSPYESDDERFALDGLRSGCAEGEMVGCDLLYFYSPTGSDDEEFGATCGGRTDGSSAGRCPPDEFRVGCADGDMVACSELLVYSPTESDARFARDGLRSGCADGDMLGCDLLFMYSPPGSEDEWFASTCGWRTDGSSAGWCAESG